MSLLDDKLRLFSEKTITVSASTETVGSVSNSNEVLDLSGGVAKDRRGTAIHPDFGAGAQPVYLMVHADGAGVATGAGTSDLVISLKQKAASGSMGSGDVVAQGVVTADALGTLADGTYLARIPIPAGRINKRYLACSIVTGGTALTGGKVSAFLTTDAEYNDAHGRQ